MGDDTGRPPVGTPYESVRAALASAARRPRLVVFVPDDVLFRGSGLDAYEEATQIIHALHAADVALALLAVTDAPHTLAAALDRAGVSHAFRSTRCLPPRLAPHSAAGADALHTALRDVRNAAGLASFEDALFFDDGSAGAAGLSALGLTLHQVSGEGGLVTADLTAALAVFEANVDAARGF